MIFCLIALAYVLIALLLLDPIYKDFVEYTNKEEPNEELDTLTLLMATFTWPVYLCAITMDWIETRKNIRKRKKEIKKSLKKLEEMGVIQVNKKGEWSLTQFYRDNPTILKALKLKEEDICEDK